MSNTDVVRASFEAYLAQDRNTAERLLAADFVFTSLQDDHIDKPHSWNAVSRRLGVSSPRRSWN